MKTKSEVEEMCFGGGGRSQELRNASGLWNWEKGGTLIPILQPSGGTGPCQYIGFRLQTPKLEEKKFVLF